MKLIKHNKVIKSKPHKKAHLSLKVSQQILYFSPEREIKLLRSDNPSYLAISAENEIFLQVFATTDKKPNKLKAYLSLACESQKISLVLE